ncbi:hypothetical protein A2814_03470 [Candidatus Nomurabacteria bacterium RIFCSPHIGHO2_01_FULL_38_19]|uniref:Transcriptional repressor PaaX-like central Cas2-like domain-containing protein n=1 Tax=Candidatus Nomurabacteria bacterium RIFCSPHIGHO2_01_FULL_38_19 TaxID=1801732 RepID=A0A1F6UU31_9BACT|nr:MAG: hypothetical protein A2814_03470 [Candidatus Nomurabacteria bacterium RIFCSPHIGHO2_01_FULL_38_19]
MSIQNDLLDLLETPRFRYKGMPVNILGLPVFKSYKRNSINTALSRLKKKQYIVFKGSCLKLSKNGKRYLVKRKARLQLFKSPFNKESSKNLLVIFDIPEIRKAEREWFRFHLRKFNYVMIQRSVWVGPSPLPEEFLSYLKHIRLIDCIKTFKLVKDYEFKK